MTPWPGPRAKALPRLRRALRPVRAFGLAAACAAASATGDDAPGSPLVVDPTTFAPMPVARSSTRVSRATAGHRGPRIALLSPGPDAVLRAGEPVALRAEVLPAADGPRRTWRRCSSWCGKGCAARTSPAW